MKQLESGLTALNINLDPVDQEKLIEFLTMLQKWNNHYNLTGITNLSEMINFHLLDSFTVAPFIHGEKVLDFGTGAGFPGIPLSIYFPQKQWYLLDSNGKKIRFLTQAKAQFNLNNVEIIYQRAEHWQTPLKFDSIVVRAVGSVSKIIENTEALIKPGGRWVIMKSESSPEETLGMGLTVTGHPVEIPGVIAKRYVHVIESPIS